MIDTVAMSWGNALGSSPRAADAPAAGRRRERLAEPIHLDEAELTARLGSRNGELTAKLYTGGVVKYGHWKQDDVELLYRPGRVELRASLPKLVHGRNDIVLNEAETHAGLRKLATIGSELAQHPLDLSEAVPTRLDYCIQFEVLSVGWILEHLRAGFRPSRKLRTENVSPFGGRSLTWGYKTPLAIRFYDKGAEVFDRERRETCWPHNIPAERLAAMSERERRVAIVGAKRAAQERAFKAANIDTILRYEIQERRRPRLRLIHENGYRAEDVRRELTQTVAGLAATAVRDFGGLLDTYGDWPHAVAYTAAAFHFAEHEADLAIVKNRVSRPAFYAWRKRMAEAAVFKVGDWRPEIPPDAFTSGGGIFGRPAQAAA